MYPLGVTTPENLISSVHSVFKVYREARERRTKVAAAVLLLESFDVTLNKLEQTTTNDNALDDAGVRTQVRVARAAWSELKRYLTPFRSDQVQCNSQATRAREVYLDIKWAIDSLDGKVSNLQEQMNNCLTAIVPGQISDIHTTLSVLTTELARLTQRLCSTTKAAKNHNHLQCQETEHQFQTLNKAATEIVKTTGLPCWERKGGCYCRCHVRTRLQANDWRYVFMDLYGWQAATKNCDLFQTCNARQYSVRIRMAACRIGLPFALTIALAFQNHSWLPKLTLTPHRVCRYTAPGFVLLWRMECDYSFIHDVPLCQQMADFKRLLGSEQASYEDVDPEGQGYLDKVLRRPWSLDRRNAQWDLVKFLIERSPKTVLKNPTLLYKCARWIGEGPHMNILETVLSLGLDPGHLDTSLFREWPELCDPGWLAEDITPDPMFVDWIRSCLQIEPGFAGCNILSEKLLTGEDDEFECALRASKDSRSTLLSEENALGQTAVHLAVLFPSRLEKLLEAGADPDCVDKGGSTPLMYAAAYGNSPSVLCLVRHGANLCLRDHRNRRLFADYAVRRHHLDVASDLASFLRKEGSNKDAQRLLEICMSYHLSRNPGSNDTEITKNLFALGVDADFKTSDWTLMHFTKSEKSAQLIMRNGFTDVNAQTLDRKTVLMHVVTLCDLKTTRRLLDQGAAVPPSDSRGWTALHYLLSYSSLSLIYAGYMEVAEKEHDFDRHAKMVACSHLLLANGALIFAHDFCECACSPDGCTPLTFALHQIRPRQVFGQTSGNFSGIMMIILSSLQEKCGRAGLAAFSAAVLQFRKFEEQNLKHTCCREKSLHGLHYRKQSSDLLEAAEVRRGHKDFGAALASATDSENVSIAKIMTELAQLCQLYEHRSLKDYREGMAKRNLRHANSVPLVEYKVDYANDTFIANHKFELLPSICKFSTKHHGGWLQWCLQEQRKLYYQGGLQRYVDRGMHLLSVLETELDRLRVVNHVETV